MLELIHPNHVTMADTISSCHMQSVQKPDNKFTTKNGSQHTINTPITIPSVFAAFFSFANLDSLRLSEKFLPYRFEAIRVRPLFWSAVSGSSSGVE